MSKDHIIKTQVTIVVRNIKTSEIVKTEKIDFINAQDVREKLEKEYPFPEFDIGEFIPDEAVLV